MSDELQRLREALRNVLRVLDSVATERDLKAWLSNKEAWQLHEARLLAEKKRRR